jgi:hypothetical protein
MKNLTLLLSIFFLSCGVALAQNNGSGSVTIVPKTTVIQAKQEVKKNKKKANKKAKKAIVKADKKMKAVKNKQIKIVN